MMTQIYFINLFVWIGVLQKWRNNMDDVANATKDKEDKNESKTYKVIDTYIIPL